MRSNKENRNKIKSVKIAFLRTLRGKSKSEVSNRTKQTKNKKLETMERDIENITINCVNSTQISLNRKIQKAYN